MYAVDKILSIRELDSWKIRIDPTTISLATWAQIERFSVLNATIK